MCGIAALQITNPTLRPQLGSLLNTMLCEVVERGPDSAGMAVYDNPELHDSDVTVISLLGADVGAPHGKDLARLQAELDLALPDAGVQVEVLGNTTLVSGAADSATLTAVLEEVLPGADVIGRGRHVAVMKSVGDPRDVAAAHRLTTMSGSRGVAHTRMATESAVTAAGSHPFAVADDLCLVHNGSFSNHASIRRELERTGVRFDSDNDSEVAARYIATRLEAGEDLETALENLSEVFDGFYTLVVTTRNGMAVVRDPIACKPAVIAETEDWVAMASEFRALAELPGIEQARVFEPEPGRVYTWRA
jgi:methylamine---glutamate N-methyltransferase subunit A